ncbi:MAG TPA: helix-turn-helix domain-containing protein [Rhodopila sp.]|nr:helix-turn-helix domain-containing protein [Rhodopila sp.]
MAQPQTAAPRMLTPVSVAARLAVSIKTVRRAIKAGELHAYQFGRLYRIAEEDLILYAARRRK